MAEEGEVFAPGDGYAQAKRCLEIIQKALQDLGADINCVVRTWMFVTGISRWVEFGQAHVEVKSLIDPAMLLEIEVDAVCLDV
ncbi:Rid family hydrolase [Fischerella thermalis]|uniref:Rid family hydrolase n=1 Tax=Fischerella thermalis TaxID=372787 RepID=UPI002155AE34|nr:Rid family hydrolase [Fischerella thermalis]